jgi:hypothetical protein
VGGGGAIASIGDVVVVPGLLDVYRWIPVGVFDGDHQRSDGFGSDIAMAIDTTQTTCRLDLRHDAVGDRACCGIGVVSTRLVDVVSLYPRPTNNQTLCGVQCA